MMEDATAGRNYYVENYLVSYFFNPHIYVKILQAVDF